MSLQRGGKVGSWPAEVLKWLVQGLRKKWLLREVRVQTSAGQVCFVVALGVGFLWWHCEFCEESNPLIYWGFMICVVVPSSLLAASEKFKTCWGSRAQWHQASENVLHSVLPVFSLDANREVLLGHSCDAKECAETWGKITGCFVRVPRMLAKTQLGLWQECCFKRLCK